MKGTRQLKPLRAAIVLALGMGFSHLAMAVGLGPIQVDSYMGQPLKASIRVSGISDSEAASSVVQLADNAAYRARGIVKTAEQSALTFKVVRSGNGHTILVNSTGRIKEPFINFILSMKSGGQIITREYAVFLNPDPAMQAGIVPMPVSAPKNKTTAKPVIAKPIALPSKEIVAANTTAKGWGGTNKTAVTEAANIKSPANDASSSPNYYYNGSGNYGPVKPGETLYSIAKVTRPSEAVSINTMMRAIYNANRSAFASSSLSSLMVGYTLRIPATVGGVTTKVGDTTSQQSSAKADESKARKVDNQASRNKLNTEEKTAKKDKTVHPDSKISKTTDDTKEVNDSKEIALPPKNSSEITPVLEKSSEAEVVPAVMTDEQVAATKPQPTEQSSEGMKLDAAESIDSGSLMPATTQSSMPEKPSEPVSTPALETKEVESFKQTAAKTQPNREASIAKPLAQEESALPFGLQSWQIAVGGLGVLALGGIGYLLARRKKAGEEVSEDALAALAAQMPDFNEEEVDSSDDVSSINNTVSLSKPAEESVVSTPVVDSYDEKTALPEQDLAALDDFFNEGNTSTSEETSIDEAISTPHLDDLEDFFATSHEQEVSPVAENVVETKANTDEIKQPTELDDLDDFFSVASIKDTKFDTQKEEVEQAIDNMDIPSKTSEAIADNFDFFDDSTEPTFDVPEENKDKTSVVTDNTVKEVDFSNLEDDFFKLDEQEYEDLLVPSSNEKDSSEIATTEVKEDLFVDEEDFLSNFEIDTFENTSKNSSHNLVSSHDATAIEVSESQTEVEAEDSLFDNFAFVDEFLSEKENSVADTTKYNKETSGSDSVEAQVPAVENLNNADVQAMDINLDLASAYINSGVKPEKAKMWLTEVLEKGNAEQKALAEDLIKKLS